MAAELAGATAGLMPPIWKHPSCSAPAAPVPSLSPSPVMCSLHPYLWLVHGEMGAFVLYLLRGKNSDVVGCKHQGHSQSAVLKSLLSLRWAQPHQSPSPSPRSDLNLPPCQTRALTPAPAKVRPKPVSKGFEGSRVWKPPTKGSAAAGVSSGQLLLGASQTSDMPAGGHWGETTEGAEGEGAAAALHPASMWCLRAAAKREEAEACWI